MFGSSLCTCAVEGQLSDCFEGSGDASARRIPEAPSSGDIQSQDPQTEYHLNITRQCTSARRIPDAPSSVAAASAAVAGGGLWPFDLETLADPALFNLRDN
eukprot:TRINITY_DN1876_c0_g2_i1.p2 TRINITY_DN1876_c0_g2~~TRINITY_DN1876_c0_g2_i1.p2  ORF type:complete len:101 (-),score=4.47 TRINITY_DN1876_c0_g2_i1:26-328(-)